MARNHSTTVVDTPARHGQALLWCERADVSAAASEPLRAAGWHVELASSVAEALERARSIRPELIIAGFVGQRAPFAGRLCQKLRGACPRHELTVVGVLEGRQLTELDPSWGLDSFVIHPFSAEEFLARVLLARWRFSESSAGVIKAGPLVIDPLHYAVSVSGRPVSLTAKEYELLRLLVEGRGRVFTRQAALSAIWGDDYYGGERTVDVHIRRLRAKLPEIAERIETVHGVGYRFGRG